MQQTTKVLLVGDGGVGKTALVKKNSRGVFEKKYIATVGVEVHQIGEYSVWDCAGQEKFARLRDGYFLDADAAILVVDVTSRLSYKRKSIWIRDVHRFCPGIPIVILANKCDIAEQKITQEQLDNLSYPAIRCSAKLDADPLTLALNLLDA